MTEKNELVPAPQGSITKEIEVGKSGIVLRTVEDAINYAKWNQESGLLPEHIKNPKQAFAIMARGAELGLKPHASWRWLYMTKGGKIAMETKGKLAVCQADPSFVDYREFIEGEDGPEEGWKAVAVAKRKNREDTIKEFSFKDAERAKLTGKKTNFKGQEYDSTYTLYLKDMLLARARDRCLDMAFADVLGGMPSKEIMDEIEAREPQERRPAVTVTVSDPLLDELGPSRKTPEVQTIIDAQVEEMLPEYPGEAELVEDETPPVMDHIKAGPQSWECGGCGMTLHVNHGACTSCGLARGEEVPPPDEHEGREAEAVHRRGKMAVAPKKGQQKAQKSILDE